MTNEQKLYRELLRKQWKARREWRILVCEFRTPRCGNYIRGTSEMSTTTPVAHLHRRHAYAVVLMPFAPFVAAAYATTASLTTPKTAGGRSSCRTEHRQPVVVD